MALTAQPPQFPRAPIIRGEERLALVEALLSVRKPTRRWPKRELQGELAGETSHIRVANQAKRITVLDKLIEDIETSLNTVLIRAYNERDSLITIVEVRQQLLVKSVSSN